MKTLKINNETQKEYFAKYKKTLLQEKQKCIKNTEYKVYIFVKTTSEQFETTIKNRKDIMNIKKFKYAKHIRNTINELFDNGLFYNKFYQDEYVIINIETSNITITYKDTFNEKGEDISKKRKLQQNTNYQLIKKESRYRQKLDTCIKSFKELEHYLLNLDYVKDVVIPSYKEHINDNFNTLIEENHNRNINSIFKDIKVYSIPFNDKEIEILFSINTIKPNFTNHIGYLTKKECEYIDLLEEFISYLRKFAKSQQNK